MKNEQTSNQPLYKKFNQESINQRISNKIKNRISRKKNVNLHLLKFSIIKNGVQNQVRTTEKDFAVSKKLYQNNPSNSNKSSYQKAKLAFKIEKQLEKQDLKQIRTLNNKPKGQVHVLTSDEIIIKVIDINKYYPSKGLIKKALSNVNLTFKKGSFNVILGESGSGKTTLLNVISGLDRTTWGQVIVNNINIQSLNNQELAWFRRENIGFIFQSYNLLSSLNVKDNIEIGRILQNNSSKRQNIKDVLKNMSMYDQEKKMIYELSGGQQQRVSIARALAKNPDILICDEPTGSLDQITSKKVFKIFKQINAKYGTTLIVVTHDQRVAALADQVIYIEDGEIKKTAYNQHPMEEMHL